MFSATRSHTNWLKCAAVQEQLDRLQSRMFDVLQCDDPSVFEVCTHIIKAGGKRLRPALVLLSAQFAPQKDDRAESLAVAIELLHVATLYHDDVVDEATKRRQLVSVNAQWSNQLAVFAGTLLLSRAIYLFAAAGDEISRQVSSALTNVWKGQMQETEAVYNLDIEADRLFEVIALKTATLYELACHIGALTAELPASHVKSLADYGRNLGIAFQLVDDAIDIGVDERLLGKPPGSDLREGIYTLPILYTLNSENGNGQKLRAILSRREFTDDDLSEALAILRTNGSVPHTLNTARSFIARAKKGIENLPDGDAKQSLNYLADFVVNRATAN